MNKYEKLTDDELIALAETVSVDMPKEDLILIALAIIDRL